MNEPDSCRLRLRLPNGAEMEAAGHPDFVRSEREAFLELAPRTAAAQAPRAPQQPQEESVAVQIASQQPSWETIIESKGPDIQLRAKLKGDGTDTDEEACLVLLAAAAKVMNSPKPTAAQIARWLRSSGYPVQRVDRAISQALYKGDILASGSRRARRYELTGPGKVKAYLLAQELTTLVTGRP